MRRRSVLAGAAALVVAGAAGVALTGGPQIVQDAFGAGGKPEIFTGNSDGIAIRGYDPVGYFTKGKPVKGKTEFSTEWKGATWQFSSAENLATFKANPGKYAPKYGGYCAYAVSQGYTAKTEPEAWTIVDGKLYLNYSLGVKATFDSDQAGYISKAEKNWPQVLQ